MKEELFTRLDTIAAKLGVAAEHLWGVMVHQAVLDAVGWLVVLCLFWGAFYIIFRRWYRHLHILAQKQGYVTLLEFVDKTRNGDEAVYPFYIALALAAIVGVTLLCTVGQIVITGLFNPEYRALQLLRELI